MGDNLSNALQNDEMEEKYAALKAKNEFLYCDFEELKKN